MAEYDMPNNSHAFKNGKVKEKPKTQKVIEGTAKTKKKTNARKLADIFLPEDVTSVKEYIFWERIVPAIKDIIHDTVDTLLYGESRRPSYSSSSRISYSGYYSGSNRPEPRKDTGHPRNAFDYDDIIFDSRIQGEQVLDNLIANGQVATQYVDLEGQPTMDQSYNPNGSLLAIEGITSPDGRVFGKMGHSERSGEYLYKNVTGDKYQPIFEGGVDYFKV